MGAMAHGGSKQSECLSMRTSANARAPLTEREAKAQYPAVDVYKVRFRPLHRATAPAVLLLTRGADRFHQNRR